MDRGPLRLLVVDDVEVNRTLMDSLLTRRGHSVELATNGAEAVAAVAGFGGVAAIVTNTAPLWVIALSPALLGTLLALIYNFMAALVGGLRVDLIED